ncbi:MAG: bifunctional (p)ppGpp synthetase/guanosine-3',5'-bis(diphosphate) 3'-pyrophosphohydrolase [Synechococcales cyanobacterium RM1_1_8]|nr:bifunctional (p)ppGpp synthetase/guanosine-3',5'-bis(diphosphate) 3'-pyrophosphohydrolase [Synechococcales cyanobacterium RM1_1_8]
MNVATAIAATPAVSLEPDLQLPAWLEARLQAQVPDLGNQFFCNTALSDVGAAESADLVCKALQFAYCLHAGQMRQSGEPYICHPIEVANILYELGSGDAVIAAGLLHDVVEDTEISPEEIEQRFGAEVRHLVEAVTKLSKFNFSNKTEQQAENFRRMFLAMAQDIRVIMVKLADRLHNMRTLQHLSEAKQRLKAQETRDIFAPLAHRLGLGRMKWELEDLAFKYLEPKEYREIQALVSAKRTVREAGIAEAIALLRQRLGDASVKVLEISGRPKHLFSIFSKMRRQNKEFHEIYDIAALRIIVDTSQECYRTLAVVHDAFRPIPGRFKDYIGLPKPNHYQSLHTAVIGLGGRPVEVQIRTMEMHQVAEYGIAAHWKYKESGGSQPQAASSDDEKFSWLRQLLEWQSDLKDAKEYLETVKNNLFDEDVYVFTPGGDVIALAQGATPVDFAYRIHSEVGNHCAGAKVDGRIVPLSAPLENGSIVEILTRESAHPSMDWMNFAVTSGAKNRIRAWFKRYNRDEHLSHGREMLERELGKAGFEALLKSAPMQQVAERCNYNTVDDLLAGLGHGGTTLNLVVNRINEAIREQQKLSGKPEAEEPLLPRQGHRPAQSGHHSHNHHSHNHHSHNHHNSRFPILGVEGMVYRLAKCCNPLPGQSIIGVVSLGSRGIGIHRQGCGSVKDVPGDRLIPVRWNGEEMNSNNPPTYPVPIQVEAIDRIGLMRDILARLSDHHINVSKAEVTTTRDRPALLDLSIDIAHHSQLSEVITQLLQLSDVLNVRRVGQ